MLTVHHLNNSRSQRVLWLLEELGLDYTVERYERDAKTMLAPSSLRAVHPLGKSPVLVDGPTTVIESGAIIEYVVRRHARGRLAPAETAPDWPRYVQLMHYAEGSAMLPLMLPSGGTTRGVRPVDSRTRACPPDTSIEWIATVVGIRVAFGRSAGIVNAFSLRTAPSAANASRSALTPES